MEAAEFRMTHASRSRSLGMRGGRGWLGSDSVHGGRLYSHNTGNKDRDEYETELIEDTFKAVLANTAMILFAVSDDWKLMFLSELGMAMQEEGLIDRLAYVDDPASTSSVGGSGSASSPGPSSSSASSALRGSSRPLTPVSDSENDDTDDNNTGDKAKRNSGSSSSGKQAATYTSSPPAAAAAARNTASYKTSPGGRRRKADPSDPKWKFFRVGMKTVIHFTLRSLSEPKLLSKEETAKKLQGLKPFLKVAGAVDFDCQDEFYTVGSYTATFNDFQSRFFSTFGFASSTSSSAASSSSRSITSGVRDGDELTPNQRAFEAQTNPDFSEFALDHSPASLHDHGDVGEAFGLRMEHIDTMLGNAGVDARLPRARRKSSKEKMQEKKIKNHKTEVSVDEGLYIEHHAWIAKKMREQLAAAPAAAEA